MDVDVEIGDGTCNGCDEISSLYTMQRDNPRAVWYGGVVNWSCMAGVAPQVVWRLTISPGVEWADPWVSALELCYTPIVEPMTVIARWYGDARPWREGELMPMVFDSGLDVCVWPDDLNVLWPEEF